MKFHTTLLLLSVILLLNCSSPQSKQENKQSIESTLGTTIPNEDEFLLRLNMLVLNNLTVPVSVIEDLKKEEESVYHSDYLNSLDNIPYYKSKFSKALNFGIYGIDIVYNASHNHILDIKKYKEKTLVLAKELGVESFYTDSDMDKFISYANSQKNLNQFIIDEYHRIDDYLISHNNYKTAVLAITGGALEGMYFTGMSIEEGGISDLKYSLLINEKHLINQIIPLYDHFEQDKKMMLLKTKLLEIQKDLNSFNSRDELTENKAKTLDNDIIVLRNDIVGNKL